MKGQFDRGLVGTVLAVWRSQHQIAEVVGVVEDVLQAFSVSDLSPGEGNFFWGGSEHLCVRLFSVGRRR